ncbi:hypothetical protein SAMD00019534_109180 [Acytostelium subglobosum LB1]|uniref:hypothetical protein n=1 Tax=Acytostelium subglobosum LB1 TaxID=1410327 RepID=UPI00064485CD|nr:hypothetical protein SAMD00019534_109180 [Acytostelium subglobosum LB1]GAM27742.1 hypothetical protein SAMD00019534_109180 [Acytostelium subglobosum LB1]|eukprot:XP_012749401.1 hypothetical protein SAMD00019534_109180 [Acytostelium subglobosum LB1]
MLVIGAMSLDYSDCGTFKNSMYGMYNIKSPNGVQRCNVVIEDDEGFQDLYLGDDMEEEQIVTNGKTTTFYKSSTTTTTTNTMATRSTSSDDYISETETRSTTTTTSGGSAGAGWEDSFMKSFWPFNFGSSGGSTSGATTRSMPSTTTTSTTKTSTTTTGTHYSNFDDLSSYYSYFYNKPSRTTTKTYSTPNLTPEEQEYMDPDLSSGEPIGNTTLYVDIEKSVNVRSNITVGNKSTMILKCSGGTCLTSNRLNVYGSINAIQQTKIDIANDIFFRAGSFFSVFNRTTINTKNLRNEGIMNINANTNINSNVNLANNGRLFINSASMFTIPFFTSNRGQITIDRDSTLTTTNPSVLSNKSQFANFGLITSNDTFKVTSKSTLYSEGDLNTSGVDNDDGSIVFRNGNLNAKAYNSNSHNMFDGTSLSIQSMFLDALSTFDLTNGFLKSNTGNGILSVGGRLNMTNSTTNINSGSFSLFSTARLHLNGGKLIATCQDLMNMTDTSMMNMENGSEVAIDGAFLLDSGTSIQSASSMLKLLSGVKSMLGDINIKENSMLLVDNKSKVSVLGNLNLAFSAGHAASGDVDIQGALNIRSSLFNNSDLLSVNGILSLNGGSIFTNHGSGQVNINANILTDSKDNSINNLGSWLFGNNTSHFIHEFVNSGELKLLSSNLTSSLFKLTDGIVSLANSTITLDQNKTAFLLNGGLLQGHGIINGDILHEAGVLGSLLSTSLLHITGNLNQTINSLTSIFIDLEDLLNLNLNISLNILGLLRLNGILSITLNINHLPKLAAMGDVSFMSYQAASGNFTKVQVKVFNPETKEVTEVDNSCLSLKRTNTVMSLLVTSEKSCMPKVPSSDNIQKIKLAAGVVSACVAMSLVTGGLLWKRHSIATFLKIRRESLLNSSHGSSSRL